MTEVQLLQVCDMRKRYGQRPVLRGVSFPIGAGEVVRIVWENWTDKSTLLRIIAGLLPVDGGQVTARGPN